jgi:hypothetical protein
VDVQGLTGQQVAINTESHTNRCKSDQ